MTHSMLDHTKCPKHPDMPWGHGPDGCPDSASSDTLSGQHNSREHLQEDLSPSAPIDGLSGADILEMDFTNDEGQDDLGIKEYFNNCLESIIRENLKNVNTLIEDGTPQSFLEASSDIIWATSDPKLTAYSNPALDSPMDSFNDILDELVGIHGSFEVVVKNSFVEVLGVQLSPHEQNRLNAAAMDVYAAIGYHKDYYLSLAESETSTDFWYSGKEDGLTGYLDDLSLPQLERILSALEKE